MDEKRCSLCGVVKPLSSFHRNAVSADGRRADCKSCRSEVGSPKRRARNRAWTAAHSSGSSQSETARRWWATRTPEQLQAHGRRLAADRATWLAALTDEEREAYRERKREAMAVAQAARMRRREDR